MEKSNNIKIKVPAYKPRSPHKPTKRHKDKTKYNRKKKHKNAETSK